MLNLKGLKFSNMATIHTTSNKYTSASYLDQLPIAGPGVRLQQPHYYGTPLCGTHYSSTNSYKYHYQNIWAVQLVTQGGNTMLLVRQRDK